MSSRPALDSTYRRRCCGTLPIALRSERMKFAAGDPAPPVTKISFVLRLGRYIAAITAILPPLLEISNSGTVAHRGPPALPGLVVPGRLFNRFFPRCVASTCEQSACAGVGQAETTPRAAGPLAVIKRHLRRLHPAGDDLRILRQRSSPPHAHGKSEAYPITSLPAGR